MPFDIGDDVHDVRVTLDDHLVGDLDAAGLGDAADVVARQIDQHHVLGAFLRVGQQFFGVAPVLLGRGAARPGAGQRADGDVCDRLPAVLSWRTRISGEAPTTWKSPKS
jgi:hypothetical protein